MRFWDTSALLALVTEQLSDLRLGSIIWEDPEVAVWWGTLVEMQSGLCRLRREGEIDDLALTALSSRVRRICAEADEVEPGEAVREAALRILRIHGLRAADALQLAAALAQTEFDPTGEEFVSADKRLREAAAKEGFTVLPTSL